MLLNLNERFMLLGILPEQGDFATLKIVRQLREALAPSEEEFVEYGIRTAGQALDDGTVVPEGQIVWSLAGQEPKEILVGEKAHDTIVVALKKMDEAKALTLAHMDLYEKFVS